jgi:two-component system sensor histidine kinase TorS
MNFRELAENLDIEEELYLELIELFIQTGTSDLDKIRSAVEERDAEQVANAAHSLKGAAVSLGLIKLSETAREIEEKARNDQLERISEAAHELKKKLDEIAELAKV